MNHSERRSEFERPTPKTATEVKIGTDVKGTEHQH